jgi:hypothetical protein
MSLASTPAAGRPDPTVSDQKPAVQREAGNRERMGSAGPWMDLACLSMDFYFFYFINRGGHQNASKKVPFNHDL